MTRNMVEMQKMICPDSARRSWTKRSSCCELTGTLPRRTRERWPDDRGFAPNGVEAKADDGVVEERAAEDKDRDPPAAPEALGASEDSVRSEGASEGRVPEAGERYVGAAGSKGLSTRCF
jgi:hypothetical protein